jgi:hypothetical protein
MTQKNLQPINTVSKADTCCIRIVQFHDYCFFTVLKNRLLDFGMPFNNSY